MLSRAIRAFLWVRALPPGFVLFSAHRTPCFVEASLFGVTEHHAVVALHWFRFDFPDGQGLTSEFHSLWKVSPCKLDFCHSEFSFSVLLAGK